MKRSSGVCAAVALLMLGACGGGEDTAQAPAAAPSPPPKPALSEAQQQAAEATAGMVSAVPIDKSKAAVTVKFDLKSRPELGQPLKIALVFIPRRDGEALSATFVSDSGLKVASDQPPAHFESVRIDLPYTYELTLTPDADGAHYVSAVVQLQTGGEPLMQTVAIPVLVGSPG